MNFLNPGLAAAGLACVAVPILIHILMRRRRRPVPWGAMQFLLAAYRQQRRRMNFEQWLLLASRCLIVALVALAIGKPVLAALTGAEGDRARTLYILLDNSLTSQTSPTASANAAAELDSLKEAARSLLSTLSPGRGDRAALVTLAAPARPEVLPPAPDAAQVSQLIDRIQPTASRADIDSAARLVRQSIAEGKDGPGNEAVVVLLSHFRAGSADLSRPLEALSTTSRRVRVLATTPAEPASDNVTITRAEPLRPLLITGDAQNTGNATASGGDAGSLPVRVELSRSGANAPGVTQVRAWVRGTFAPADAPQPNAQSAVITWNAGQRTASAFLTLDARSITAGGAILCVQTDADTLAGDNTYLRPLESVATLRVALIAPAVAAGSGAGLDSFASQDWLALALAPLTPNPLRTSDASGIRVEVVDPARLAATPGGNPAPELAGAGAVIVTQPHTLDAGAWRAVATAAARGSFVLVIPPEGEATHLWTDGFVDALGLPWVISREPAAVGGDEGLALAPQSTLSADEDLLALVRPELGELVKPVRVRRTLTISAGAGPSQGTTTPTPPAATTTLLSLTDGTPLLVSAHAGSARAQQAGGIVVLWLAPPALSWTDLPAKPLMVPLMQELIRQGAGRSGPPRTLTAGQPFRAAPGATELASTSDSALIRLTTDAAPLEPLRDAGLWRVRAGDGRTLSLLAVNPDPAAGDTTPQRADDILRWLGGLSADVSLLDTPRTTGQSPAQSTLTTRRDVPPISLPLLAAAAGLAVLELLMARWFSHAKVDAGQPALETGAAGTGRAA